MSNRASGVGGLIAGAAIRPVIPTDFDEAVRFARTAVEAGLFQAESEEKALAQATMAVLQGLELGIPPMQAVQQIATIGGRLSIWGDLVPALIWRAGHRIREWIEGEGDARVAWCEITRGDNQEVIRRKFSVADAKRAGLWDKRPTIKKKDKANVWREEDNESAWYRYQERMLQMRARGFCAHDGAPDALHGLYLREEIEEEEQERRRGSAKVITPQEEGDELLPPPAPNERLETLDARPPSASEESATQSEADTDPDDVLSDLDVNLAACRTGAELDEVWAEHLETICNLGMTPRQKAELMYDRHRARVTGQVSLPVEEKDRSRVAP